MPTGKKTLSVYIILAFLLVLVILACVSLGAVSVPFDKVLSIIAGKLLWLDAGASVEKSHELIVWDIRLPRVLLAATIGGGLSIVGAVMQAMFRNPLAEPGILGWSSGGAFFAVSGNLYRHLSAVVSVAPSCRFCRHTAHGICSLRNIPLQRFCREQQLSFSAE